MSKDFNWRYATAHNKIDEITFAEETSIYLSDLKIKVAVKVKITLSLDVINFILQSDRGQFTVCKSSKVQLKIQMSIWKWKMIRLNWQILISNLDWEILAMDSW